MIGAVYRYTLEHPNLRVDACCHAREKTAQTEPKEILRKGSDVKYF